MKSVKRENGDNHPDLHVSSSQWQCPLARFPQTYPTPPKKQTPHTPPPLACHVSVWCLCWAVCVVMCNPQSPITPVNPYLDALFLSLSLKPFLSIYIFWLPSTACFLFLSLYCIPHTLNWVTPLLPFSYFVVLDSADIYIKIGFLYVLICRYVLIFIWVGVILIKEWDLLSF